VKKPINPIDRSPMIERMKKNLLLDVKRTAVITIDCQRGNLDPKVASLPVPDLECRRVLSGINSLIAIASKIGIPIIHVTSAYEEPLLRAHPFVQAMLSAKESFTPHRQSDYARHKRPGSPEAELMPEIIVRTTDYRIDSKRTFDMFYGTQLEILLRALGVETLLLAGCNTNTCVLSSTFGAYIRNFRVVVLSDCVASAYGEDLHHFSLLNIQRRLGWVITLDELKEKLEIAG